MPLPTDEDGFRALEQKCASPQSSASKNTVAQLSEQISANCFFLLGQMQTKPVDTGSVTDALVEAIVFKRLEWRRACAR